MNKNGPILVIEDDMDDQNFIQSAYEKLNYTNELIFLDDGEVAIKYLIQMNRIPLLIISDLNMPRINGIELRTRVHQNETIRIKCVPYIIFSTTVTKTFIDDAYSLGIQGYFKKPTNLNELVAILRNVIEYWKISYAPGMYM